MGYADYKKIPFGALIGENEISQNMINLKDMLSGEQKLISFNELISLLK